MGPEREGSAPVDDARAGREVAAPALPAHGPRREPPHVPGYRLHTWERLPLTRLNVVGLVSLPVWFVFFFVVGILLGGPDRVEVRLTLTSIGLAILVVLVGVPVLHEAVHGAVALLAGARPRFGVGPGYAYTTFSDPVGRGAYLAIGLAPLVVLSIAGVALQLITTRASGLIQLALVVNAAGAVGDLWMAWRLRSLPEDARIYDLADGFAAFVPERTT